MDERRHEDGPRPGWIGPDGSAATIASDGVGGMAPAVPSAWPVAEPGAMPAAPGARPGWVAPAAADGFHVPPWLTRILAGAAALITVLYAALVMFTPIESDIPGYRWALLAAPPVAGAIGWGIGVVVARAAGRPVRFVSPWLLVAIGFVAVSAMPSAGLGRSAPVDPERLLVPLSGYTYEAMSPSEAAEIERSFLEDGVREVAVRSVSREGRSVGMIAVIAYEPGWTRSPFFWEVFKLSLETGATEPARTRRIDATELVVVESGDGVEIAAWVHEGAVPIVYGWEPGAAEDIAEALIVAQPR